MQNDGSVKLATEQRSLDEIFAGWEREGEAVLRGVKKSKTVSTPSASYKEFKKDMTFVYAVSRDKDDISKQELTKMLKPHYSLGNLFNHDLFGDYSNREVIIPNHMIAYALTKHRDQIHLQEFFKIKEVIERPDFVSEDILGMDNAFLLNKKVDENRFIEAGIEDKNGQFIFHFMVRNKNKNNKRLKKIMRKSKKYDIINQKVYNIDKE